MTRPIRVGDPVHLGADGVAYRPGPGRPATATIVAIDPAPFTPRERAELHSSLDALIARCQPYDVRYRPEAQHRRIWPSPEDYERIDAEHGGEVPGVRDVP